MSRSRNELIVPKTQRGFTLLEIMVASVIFVVGFLGIVALNVAAIDYTRVSSDISLGSNLAANNIEELRVSNYDTLSAEQIFYDQFGKQLSRIAFQSDPPVPSGCFFTVTTTITEDPSGMFKDVKAATSWYYAPSPHKHEVSMQSRVIE